MRYAISQRKVCVTWGPPGFFDPSMTGQQGRAPTLPLARSGAVYALTPVPIAMRVSPNGYALTMLLEFELTTLLLCALVSFLAALDVGYRLGRRRQDKTDEPDKSHTSALQGATLGLLALLLGFTFAMAVSRFDNRKTVILDQANAIGTAELRSRLLPASQAATAAPLFRNYVDAWLQYRAAGTDIAAVKSAEHSVFQIESELWKVARDATANDPHSLPAGLFAAAMNDVIDLHEKRHRSLEDHVPDAVILLLFAVSILALGQVAYSSGLSGRRRQIANVIFAFVIALVLVVILDVDRPRRGLIQVSQDSMLRLQESLERSDRVDMKKLLVLAALWAASSVCQATGFTILCAVRFTAAAPMHRAGCARRSKAPACCRPPATTRVRAAPRFRAGRGSVFHQAQGTAPSRSMAATSAASSTARWRCANSCSTARRIDAIRRHERAPRARLSRHQVQHALGHLPAELGARPALRHGARPEILGALPRHDGREPLQRRHRCGPCIRSLT